MTNEELEAGMAELRKMERRSRIMLWIVIAMAALEVALVLLSGSRR